MKVNKCHKPELGFEDYEDREFNKWDLEHVPTKVQSMWYWYGYGCYEGSGHIIAVDEDGLWHHHDCSHCSCYGPLERIDFSIDGKPLIEMYESFSSGLLAELQPITEELNKAGYVTTKRKENAHV